MDTFPTIPDTESCYHENRTPETAAPTIASYFLVSADFITEPEYEAAMHLFLQIGSPRPLNWLNVAGITLRDKTLFFDGDQLWLVLKSFRDTNKQTVNLIAEEHMA